METPCVATPFAALRLGAAWLLVSLATSSFAAAQRTQDSPETATGHASRKLGGHSVAGDDFVGFGAGVGGRTGRAARRRVGRGCGDRCASWCWDWSSRSRLAWGRGLRRSLGRRPKGADQLRWPGDGARFGKAGQVSQGRQADAVRQGRAVRPQRRCAGCRPADGDRSQGARQAALGGSVQASDQIGEGWVQGYAAAQPAVEVGGAVGLRRQRATLLLSQRTIGRERRRSDQSGLRGHSGAAGGERCARLL